MKNALNIDSTFARVEFWAATTIFAFVMFFFITEGFDQDNSTYIPTFKQEGIPFDFYENFFIPQFIRNVTLYLVFLLMNFIVIPQLVRKQRLAINILIVVVVFFAMVFIFGVTDFYMKRFYYGRNAELDLTNKMLLEIGFEVAFTMFAVLAIYSIIKYLSLYMISISGSIESKYPFIRREGIVATIIWIIGLLFLLIAEADNLLIAGWIIAIPSAILLYLLGFYTLIPSSINKKYPFITYAFKNGIILFLILMAWGLILKIVVGGDQAHLAALWIFNSVLQMSVTIPITWLLYKRHMKGNEQINVLKKELGQTHASFDFLRSQINPHFLFNALNTIYGTALQEGAERTSEAVQKLGDMMRFMLQENMQEKISLTREIDYLNNYISIQQLRTATNPDIKIQTEIEPTLHNIQVAPMLFIPFIENAFKHGISFREPSYISIAMEVKGGIINFDVKNSKHPKHANDPEADKSGIGLNNVQQRLQLLYPGKHELVIKETDKEFSVHLTLQTT